MSEDSGREGRGLVFTGGELHTIGITVFGKVQRVGFRNCIRRIALRLGVGGEVMNLPDGSVRIVVTGEQVVLEKFLAMVYMCPRAVVKDVTVTVVEPRDFTEFSIVRE